MPFFPIFVDLSQKKVLVVGGGKVAHRKVKSLLRFTKNIKVVAPKVSEELEELIKEKGLKLVRRYFRSSDLKGVDLVIVAVNKLSLQERIFRMCEKRGILCNSVDSPNLCNFLFPSLIVRGDVTLGISTSGRAPALSRRLRELIEECLPEDLEGILDRIAGERERLPKGRERQELMNRLTEELLKPRTSSSPSLYSRCSSISR